MKDTLLNSKANKIFGIRADASTDIGVGHLMRCTALADAIYALGGTAVFFCRQLDASLARMLHVKGHVVEMISETPHQLRDAEETARIIKHKYGKMDWIIVDHYHLDITWEKKAREFAERIFVIDDLPGRAHHCDAFLNQNKLDADSKLQDCLLRECLLLLGPQYALLRAEFAAHRPRTPKNGAIKQLLINFGGSDPTNEILKALIAIERVQVSEFAGIKADVIFGPLNPLADTLTKRFAVNKNWRLLRYADNMAELMANADLAIGAAGSTSWERCCVGLPAIVTVLSHDQTEIAEGLVKAGAAICLKPRAKQASLTADDYLHTLVQLSAEKISAMSQAALKLVDGQGALRVAQQLFAILED